MARAFISYSRRDTDFVRQLNDALVAHKREAWVDWKDIPLTAEWQQEILTNIETADSFIFVISPDSVTSPNCRKEIDHAVSNNKRMVPIFRRPVPDDAIPPALGRFQRIHFVDGDDFNSKFTALISALDTDLAWVQMHTRLLTRAKEWEREGKDNSFLLRGKDLREAERWVAQSSDKDPKPTTLQSQYVLASRQSATKLQRIVIAAVTAAFLIAVGLAVYAFIQRNVAKQETAVAQRNEHESKARELAALSIESLRTDPEKSILLGMQAVHATLRFGQPPLPTAEEALHQALLSSQVRATLLGHLDSVGGVAFSPDGKRLATVSADHTAKVWDAESGKELLTLHGHLNWVTGVAFSPDGKRLATASVDQTAKLWDAESGKELLTLLGHSGSVYGVAFSPDGKRLATAGEDKTAKVWDAEGSKELLTLRGRSVGVTFSPDGKRLATASEDKTATVWDADSGKALLTLHGHSDSVIGVAFSPDGKRLATASADHTAKVWNAESSKELLSSSDLWVTGVAFSPDGKRLATASVDQTAKVWDADSGKELLTLHGHSDSVYSVVFSSDGERLATASVDHTAKVWDAKSGRELLTLRGHSEPLDGVAFSPDGKRLATAGGDKTAKVWDANSGKELLTLSGHTDNVSGVAFSPDGKRLATASGDKTAKVWDAESGKELLTLLHSGPVDGVAFSPDGKRLATASEDWSVQVYALDLRELLKLARSRVTRTFTTEECQRYFQSGTCPSLP
jgi:WD40 repeat protein